MLYPYKFVRNISVSFFLPSVLPPLFPGLLLAVPEDINSNCCGNQPPVLREYSLHFINILPAAYNNKDKGDLIHFVISSSLIYLENKYLLSFI